MDKIKHKFISVTYKLYIDNEGKENLEEETPEGKPLQFYSGFGMVLNAFEQKLLNSEGGSNYDISLTPAEGYGEYIPERVVKLSRDVFMDENGKFDSKHIYLDTIIPLQNEDGNHFLGQVKNIGDTHLTIDLNHPLAGKTLHFIGKVLENREANEEEIQNLLNKLNSHHRGNCGGNCGEHECGGNCGGCH